MDGQGYRGKKIKELGASFDWGIFQISLYTLDSDLFDNTNSFADQFPFKYGDKTISPYLARMIEHYSDVGTERTVAFDIYQLYGESWKRIKSALEAEYNPIENYDRNESTEVSHTGKDTDNYGQQSNTKGQETTTFGERSDTNGAQSTEYGQKLKTYGAHTDIDQHDVSAYNQNTYNPESKDTHTIAQRVDIDDPYTDTTGQRVDIKGQEVDTYSARTDTVGAKTDEHNKNTKDTTTGRVHGNVGVTTNQQMIEAELSLRERFKFLDIIMKDISHELCLRCYSL